MVRDSYDGLAEQYAAIALGDLGRDTPDRDWLTVFAKLAASNGGVVADLGCGPGHVVDHLTELGVTAVGYDLSPGQIAQARRAFPDSQFQVGDLASLDVADSSLGGIVARYSLIHMLPSHLGDVFEEWMRVLERGAPVLVSFFAAASANRHGSPFDHAVTTAYEFFPAAMAKLLRDAGFGGVEVGTRGPLAGERPLHHATVLAVKREV